MLSRFEPLFVDAADPALSCFQPANATQQVVGRGRQAYGRAYAERNRRRGCSRGSTSTLVHVLAPSTLEAVVHR